MSSILNVIASIVSVIPIEKMLARAPDIPDTMPGYSTTVSNPVIPHTPQVIVEQEISVEDSIEDAVNDVNEEEKGEGVSALDEADYSGTSQISAAGRACIPCSNDHIGTSTALLKEAIRFAREGGINHPEVLDRITKSEDELLALERGDGDIGKISKLPLDEREYMTRVVKEARHMRHLTKEIDSPEKLEEVAQYFNDTRTGFRREMFDMQMGRVRAMRNEGSDNKGV